MLVWLAFYLIFSLCNKQLKKTNYAEKGAISDLRDPFLAELVKLKTEVLRLKTMRMKKHVKIICATLKKCNTQLSMPSVLLALIETIKQLKSMSLEHTLLCVGAQPPFSY